MSDLTEITPEGSVVPVYLDPAPAVPVDESSLDYTTWAAAQAALRQSGIDKLMALGLTEDEARAIAGVDPV